MIMARQRHEVRHYRLRSRTMYWKRDFDQQELNQTMHRKHRNTLTKQAYFCRPSAKLTGIH
jgi:hypothetical protein